MKILTKTCDIILVLRMEPPKEPDESECCNSGCNPCIFEVYEQQLKRYKQCQLVQSPIEQNCLKPLKYTPFTLVNILEHTKDTNIYVFQFQSLNVDVEESAVIYGPGQHLLIKMKSNIDNNEFTRPYTPIPWEGLTHRQFAVVIKLYPCGDMSGCIKRLTIGDLTEWRGPYGDYIIDYQQQAILLIAQGTGIAPIYAIVKQMLENEECETRLKLIYCCRDLEQVHLRDQLYSLKSYWNFDYEVFLSGDAGESKESVKYNEVVHWRRLREEVLQERLQNGAKANWSSVLICGSEVFANSIREVVKRNLEVPIHIF